MSSKKIEKSYFYFQQLERIRNSLRLNKMQMCEKMSVIQQTYTKFSYGQKPSVETLANLVKGTNVNLNWFVTGEGSMFLREETQESQKDPQKAGKSANEDDKVQLIMDLTRENMELRKQVTELQKAGEAVSKKDAISEEVEKEARKYAKEQVAKVMAYAADRKRAKELEKKKTS